MKRTVTPAPTSKSTQQPAPIPWRRFWCLRGGTINLLGGYLADPEDRMGGTLASGVVPTEHLAELPFTVLLGEPGLGKSTTVKSLHAVTSANAARSGDATLLVDLAHCWTKTDVESKVFKAPEVKAWIGGTHSLTLTLDSLDECRTSIPGIAAMLLDELREAAWPLSRLRLRIACRTGSWPLELEEGLRTLDGVPDPQVFELAPLRRRDVEDAASKAGQEPKAFLAEVARRDLTSLAIKPITLTFLLDALRGGADLGGGLVEIYRDGCRELCRESNQHRRVANRQGSLTVEQRMIVAGRIAAAMVFSATTAVVLDPDTANAPAHHATIEALAGGTEKIGRASFVVTGRAVEEVLQDTALFSAVGPGVHGWSHQTYAEFLAAWYVIQRAVPTPAVLSLLVHPADAEGRLVPQLTGVATWLASMSEEVFREILEREPEILIASDVGGRSENLRAQLVDRLLQRYASGTAVDRDWNLRVRYDRLNHPSLATQLRPWLRDHSASKVVRRVAREIAESCQVVELVSDLSDIALDATDDPDVRAGAAAAVMALGDDAAKIKLKPLLTVPTNQDPMDSMAGEILMGLWPRLLTAAELFQVLRAPRRENYLGSYFSFLSSTATKPISTGDLPLALEWVAAHVDRTQPLTIQEFANSIMRRAWAEFSQPEIQVAFATAALARLEKHEPIIAHEDDQAAFSEGTVRTPDDRRRLVELIVTLCGTDSQVPIRMMWTNPPLLPPTEFRWVLRHALEADGDRKVWRDLAVDVYRFLNGPSLEDVEALLAAVEMDASLRTCFAPHLTTVPIDSEQAKEAREAQARWRKQAERPRPALLDPPPPERVALALAECERNIQKGWLQLFWALTLEPASTHYPHPWDVDAENLPGLRSASPEVRAAIAAAAGRYVVDAPQGDNEWTSTNTIPGEETLGYHALRVILREAPDLFETLPAVVWRRWAAIVLAFPGSDKDAALAREPLLQHVLRDARAELEAVILANIDGSNERETSPSLLQKLDEHWDARLTELVLRRLEQGGLCSKTARALGDAIVEHDEARSSARIEALIDALRSSVESNDAAVELAASLFLRASDAGWRFLRPRFKTDAAFSEAVLHAALPNLSWHSDQNFAPKLTSKQARSLYQWLRSFKSRLRRRDPNNPGAVSDREKVEDLQRVLLDRLTERGTAAACRELERLAQGAPGNTGLRYRLLAAHERRRQRTWRPPTLADVLEVISDHERRLVQTGEQLLDVVSESLVRLQAELVGETPSARCLWNEAPTLRPKEETALSDFVARHLKTDLRGRKIILNREVEIRPTGPGVGERTDLLVQAFASDESVGDAIELIIEVKGSWNPDLWTSMENQLAKRYLQGGAIRHGLYLVGWFNCALWDTTDRRRGKSKKMSAAQAQIKLEVQAREVSQRNRVTIRALVLDAGLRGERKPRPKSRRTRFSVKTTQRTSAES